MAYSASFKDRWFIYYWHSRSEHPLWNDKVLGLNSDFTTYQFTDFAQITQSLSASIFIYKIGIIIVSFSKNIFEN